MSKRIPKPSVLEVKKYLKRWSGLKNYTSQESSLKKLFTITYPDNKNLDHVLIKVCALNTFYSTHIYSPYTVAKHIVSLGIDKSLLVGDLKIVNKIALVKMSNEKSINFYSFATKYCSHHKPLVYPIYDSYVDKVLMYFKREDKFDTFTQKNLKDHSQYKEIVLNFRKFYKLERFNLKELDQYLWQLGKKYYKK